MGFDPCFETLEPGKQCGLAKRFSSKSWHFDYYGKRTQILNTNYKVHSNYIETLS